MDEFHNGRRSRNPVRNTWNSCAEAVNGWLLALASMSLWLWRRRSDRDGLKAELEAIPGGVSMRPRLWRQSSVFTELAVTVIFYSAGHLMGANETALRVLAVSLFAAFILVTEPVNTVLEWLINRYQQTVQGTLQPNPFVRSIKHVAAVPTLALNGCAGVVWLLLVMHVHVVL